ncbi:MAG: hypothetical protein V1747_08995 [Candidatus Omnitrophota bacterium]
MKKNQGFTLLEVQISAMLMIVVLIATGVIFYFALASIRYMHDAFAVYTNATTAMKLITDEVMRSNCYGSAQGPGAANPPFSFYGPGGYIHQGGVSGEEAINAYFLMPTLVGSNALVVSGTSWGTGFFLRQATQASTIRAEAADVAGDFPAHEIVQIYRQWDVSATMLQLVVDREATGAQIIANNVTQFDFQPIAYNAVHVILTVEGTILDPLGGGIRHSITLSKQITLRCAPSLPPIPDGVSW